MKIIFENEFIVAIDKAAQVLSVPSRMGNEDARPCAGLLLQKQLGIQIYPCHRLDYEVSGLLVFAKNPKAHRELNQIFENHQLEKTYQAFSPYPEDFQQSSEKKIWKSRIFKGKKRSFESPHGKDSLTHAWSFPVEDDSSILEWVLQPQTGRSHQLRFEMYKHGHPILGDKLYNSDREWNYPGIALRSISIQLHQPLFGFQKLSVSKISLFSKEDKKMNPGF